MWFEGLIERCRCEEVGEWWDWAQLACEGLLIWRVLLEKGPE